MINETHPNITPVATPNPFAEVTAGQSTEMPAKMVIYGVPKIGKSRFCADADDAFFINIEGGLDYIGKKVRSTPKLDNFEDVMGWLVHILDSETFKAGTIVVDSLDWMETLAQQKLVKQEKAKSIVDPAIKAFAYYKGVEMAASDTMRLFTALDMIYRKKGIKSIVIAHSQIKNIDLPNQDPYSRHDMKLSKYLGAKAMEWADLVIFADYSFHVTKEGKTSEPKPCLFAGGNASFVGGGRMLLDKELPLNYEMLKKHITNKGAK